MPPTDPEALDLRDHALLVDVDPDAIAQIREVARPSRLAAGDLLITVGASPRTLYFILEGELAVHIHGLDQPPVAVLGPGQTVGEMSILLGGASTADVRASTPCLVVAIGEIDFWRFVNLSHPFAIGMLHGIGAETPTQVLLFLSAANATERDRAPGYFFRSWPASSLRTPSSQAQVRSGFTGCYVTDSLRSPSPE